MAGLVAVLELGVLLALAAPVAAQGLTDPTRPPRQLTGDASSRAEPDNPLQSVLISGTRKAAVINGQVVPLGGMVGRARLIRVMPSEVTLDTGESLEVLKLFPGVQKAPGSETNSPNKEATTEDGK